MINKDILEYIEKYKNTYSHELLIEKLKAAGYPPEDIDDSLKTAPDSPWADIVGWLFRLVAFVFGIGIALLLLFIEGWIFESSMYRYRGLNFSVIIGFLLVTLVINNILGYFVFRRSRAVRYGIIAGSVIPGILIGIILFLFRGFFW